MAAFEDLSAIERRAADIREWLQKNAPDCLVEQRHLEEGSRERVYWHYGYMVALRDVLRFLTGSEKPSSQKQSSADTSKPRSVA